MRPHPALFYVGEGPALAFFTCVPFGLTPRQTSAWLRYGGGMALAQEVFRPFSAAFPPSGTPAPRWSAGSAAGSARSGTCKG
ncbi:hypothetical protein GCM10009416_36900 [Craurococcus roseus]|uniref:Uncharacterized protein n=1 Tax=Craurococcus roseus TaxID=77585 RepID=A0ABN1FQ46_9PROT